jgi:hypothetical protein
MFGEGISVRHQTWLKVVLNHLVWWRKQCLHQTKNHNFTVATVAKKFEKPKIIIDRAK